MIIKKYLVSDIDEAQFLINQELGPHAVILTTRKVTSKGIKAWFSSGKIEVTVGVDEEDLNSFKRNIILTDRNETQNESSPTLWHNNLATLKQLFNQIRTNPSSNPSFSHVNLEDTLTNKMESVSAVYADSPSLIDSNLKNVLLALKQRLANRFSGKDEVAASSDESSDKIPGIARFLIAKGVVQSIALEVVSKIFHRLSIHEMPSDNKLRTDFLNVLKRELAALIKTAGPIALNKNQPKICAFVGPTGVGKTTTVVKIALQYITELQKQVGIITLDTIKIGGYEQTLALTQKFNIPLARASSVTELQEALKMFENYDLVLIDTSGRSQYQWQKVDELVDVLSTVNSLETHLVMSAATKDVDFLGAIQQFSRLNIEGIICSKLDETIAYGIFINICQKGGKPISYLTTGPQIPGDLVIASSDEIARSILVQHNTQEFDAIRQMANK